MTYTTKHTTLQKKKHMNFLYAQVHKLISHTQPITDSETGLARDSIKNYRTVFRNKFPHIKFSLVSDMQSSICECDVYS